MGMCGNAYVIVGGHGDRPSSSRCVMDEPMSYDQAMVEFNSLYDQTFRHSMFAIGQFAVILLMVWAVRERLQLKLDLVQSKLDRLVDGLAAAAQTGLLRSGAANTGTGGATPVAAARVEGALEMA